MSIWMLTYNHEAYIAQAIEGVMMQQTSFTFELVIGEDCSTDRTREIVLAYKDRYPDKIRLFLPDHNLGILNMVKATYNLCTGPYVASLDGDDYWTDPLKLQKQVDFMEANPAYVGCFHTATVIDEIRGRTYEIPDLRFMPVDNVLTIDVLLRGGNPVPTASLLYRNVLGDKLPDWYYEMPYPDLAFYFLLIKYGNMKFTPETMCVYRVHKAGAWSGKSEYHNYSEMLRFYRQLNENLNPKYIEINRVISYYSFELVKIDVSQNNVEALNEHLKGVLLTKSFMFYWHRKRQLPGVITKILFLYLKRLGVRIWGAKQ